MEPDELLDRFYAATFDKDDIDHEAFLAEGGEEIADAVLVHQLFQSASKSWREPRRPEQLDRFDIVGDLGAGGLGKVYLGWDPDLRRHVAIKVIARDRWASNEARSIAKLDHQSIVKVYEVGRDHLVMELLDGGTLQDKIQDIIEGYENNMSALRARLHCLVRIAQGLAYCHDRGILHRDVKPSNVLFALEDEHPRLIDFGLAHLDELESLDITQSLVGSPAYLAPEQVESGETGSDSRADIFSFGTLAYELLTLESPFKRATRQETLDAVSAAQPTNPRKLNPEISKPVCNILAHCMEPDPRKRYESMHGVVLDLQDALADRPISVGSRSVVHRAQLLLKRNRRVTAFATLGMAIAAILAIGLWVRALRGERLLLVQEIADIRSRIPKSQSVHDVNGIGVSLQTTSERANVLDNSMLGRWLAETKPDAQAALEHWSRHLSAQLDTLATADLGNNPPAIWRGVVSLEEFVLPDATWNAKYRTRGLVSLSEELGSNPNLVLSRLLVREPNSPRGRLFEFTEVPLSDYPENGFYRLEIPGTWQREFLIDSPWCPMIEIERVPPRLDSTGWTHIAALGILVSPLIDCAHHLEFDTQFFFGKNKNPTDPAVVSMQRAQAFANWAGGRLPTGAELDALFDCDVELRNYEVFGEYVTDLDLRQPLQNGAQYIYSGRIATPSKPVFNRLEFILRTAHMIKDPPIPTVREQGPGFRVVYLAPGPEGR